MGWERMEPGEPGELGAHQGPGEATRGPTRPLVYFLCTGNACRSQMAEGFARQLGDGWLEVASAGIAPAGLDPRAVVAMAELGVDISNQASKAIAPDLLDRATVVVTLCGDAAERCPLPPAHVRRLHWPLPDPARAAGSPAEVAAAFRAVRDALRARVAALVAELAPGATQLPPRT